MKVKSKRLIGFILIIYNLVFCFGIPTVAKDLVESETIEVLSDDVELGSRFFELFFGEQKKEEISLLPGGGVFGVKIKQEHPTVAEAKGVPALKVGDVILSVGG